MQYLDCVDGRGGAVTAAVDGRRGLHELADAVAGHGLVEDAHVLHRHLEPINGRGEKKKGSKREREREKERKSKKKVVKKNSEK